MADNEKKARDLRAEVSSTHAPMMNPRLGKGYATFDDMAISETASKNRAAARDATMNRKEEEAEMYEERARREGVDKGEIGKSYKKLFGGDK